MRFDARQIAGLCNGSTPDSDSVCEGSNPSSAAKATHHCRWVAFLFALGTRTRTKQIKSAHEVPKALRGFESFIRCQKQFIGFNELFFYYGSHFPHGEYPAAIASSRV